MSKWYELVVFTASMEIYGTAVADRLDNNTGILRRRYYRQHCTLDFGSYTKDLAAICSDLSSVFILDNSPGAYRAYPGNPVLLLPRHGFIAIGRRRRFVLWRPITTKQRCANQVCNKILIIRCR